MARASATREATSSGETAPRSAIWLQGLVCGSVVTLATPSALLGAVLLAPALLAWRLDREAGRPVARAVLVCALAGAIHPLVRLWLGGHSLALATVLLSDPWSYIASWGAGAGGWMLAELSPLGLRMGLELAAVTRAARLRSQRAQLEREWGIPAAGSSPAEEG